MSSEQNKKENKKQANSRQYIPDRYMHIVEIISRDIFLPYMALIGVDGSLSTIHSFIPFWLDPTWPLLVSMGR